MYNPNNKMVDATFLLQRGPADIWAELDPILGPGEPGFELDTGKLKIGDGVSLYSALPYIGADAIPNLATVATSGNYNDLLNLPTIPPIPTKISTFINDADYATISDLNKAINSLPAIDNEPTPNSSNLVTSGTIYSTIDTITQIANGKTACYVFDTTEDLDLWLNDSDNTDNLKTGDVFLIRAIDVPDWWWDGTTRTKQKLETTKVDLSDYALKSSIPTKTSQLTNDSGFLTTHQSLADVNATKVNGYQIVVSNSIPTVDDQNIITFVK